MERGWALHGRAGSLNQVWLRLIFKAEQSASLKSPTWPLIASFMRRSISVLLHVYLWSFISFPNLWRLLTLEKLGRTRSSQTRSLFTVETDPIVGPRSTHSAANINPQVAIICSIISGHHLFWLFKHIFLKQKSCAATSTLISVTMVFTWRNP